MFKYVFSLILAVIFYFVFLFDTVLTNDVIGSLFVTGILGCLVVFLLFKFGLHYKIMGLNRFANAFYYSVFEYKKAQVSPSELSYMDSVREQAEVALAANFDPTLKTADLKIPTTLYSGKDPFWPNCGPRFKKQRKSSSMHGISIEKRMCCWEKPKKNWWKRTLPTKHPPRSWMECLRSRMGWRLLST